MGSVTEAVRKAVTEGVTEAVTEAATEAVRWTDAARTFLPKAGDRPPSRADLPLLTVLLPALAWTGHQPFCNRLILRPTASPTTSTLWSEAPLASCPGRRGHGCNRGRMHTCLGMNQLGLK